MTLYETIFIARQDMSPAQVETLTEKFTKIITDNGGSVGKTEYCGLRTLAYLIKKNSKGHYVLMNITAPSSALKEAERLMSISEDILRFLSVKVEKHEEEASSLLKASRYRDDSNPRDNQRDTTPRDNSRNTTTTDAPKSHDSSDKSDASSAH